MLTVGDDELVLRDNDDASPEAAKEWDTCGGGKYRG